MQATSSNARLTRILSGLLAALLVLAAPVPAQPPHAKGGGGREDGDARDGKGKGHRKSEEARPGKPDDRSRADRDSPSRAERSRPSGRHFEDRHRTIVREYYVTEYRTGHCPPGLAKKNNGCMPPGQAKKWRIGQPLPREVVYYEVPQALVVRIGPPPAGHRYVRVAADILLIAIGTGLVIDAIADLENL
jgi:Ni/Co efflux regulator RcnB